MYIAENLRTKVSKNGAFLFLVDVCLCLVLQVTVSQMLCLSVIGKFCGCQDLVSALEADGNCLAVQSHDATVKIVYLVMKLFST